MMTSVKFLSPPGRRRAPSPLSPALRAALLGFGLSLAAGCGEDPVDSPDAPDLTEPDLSTGDTDLGPDVPPDLGPGLGIDYAATAPGAQPTFDPTSGDWLSVGWPSDRWRVNGRLAIDNFPGADNPLLETFIGHANEALDGFGLNSASYFAMSGPIDPTSLPSPDASLAADSHLQLVNVTPTSPMYGQRVPIVARVQTHATDALLPEHTLALRPVYGFPLTEGERWCAIVTRALRDTEGRYLAQASGLKEALPAEPWLAPLHAWLPESPLNADDIAAAACFTTQRASYELHRLARWIDDSVPPEVELVFEPFVFNEFHGTYTAPNFQEGVKPYANSGGGLRFDAAGDPIVQDEEAIRYLLLVPRDLPMPESGWPIVIYSHGTGGDYTSCRGTASELLPRGFAVLCTDQPLHGSRGPGGRELDENGLILYSFNFMNPPAGRGSFRQAAADTLIQSWMVEAGRFDIDAAHTKSGQPVRLDPLNIMFFGHSHGGLSGTLALGVDARIKAGVISGMAGVLIETILRRDDIVDLGALAALILGVPQEQLDTFHPALNLIQTLVDATDPINYTRLWLAPGPGSIPRHMFVTQGTLDDASPAIGNDAAAAAGLIPIASPLARESEGHRLRGMAPVNPPFAGNIERPDGGRFTAVMRQWQGGSHFVATNVVARGIWGHFLETATGEAPPEVPDFGPLNTRPLDHSGASDCAEVQPIDATAGFPIELRGNTALADARFAIETCGDVTGRGALGRDLVYRFDPPSSGRYRVRLSVPSALSASEPRAAPNLLYVSTVCGQADAETCLGAAGRANLDLALEAGTPTYLHVDGDSPFDRGPFTLTIERICEDLPCDGRDCGFAGCTPCGTCQGSEHCAADGQCAPRLTGDGCADPHLIDAVPYARAGSTRLANNDSHILLNECPSFPYAFGAGSGDEVYRLVAPVSGTFAVRADAVHDVVLYASEGCEDPGASCLAAARGLWDPTRVNLTLSAGEVAFIHVDGTSNAGNSAGDYTLRVDLCEPRCGEHPCGDDGCGGSCGACPGGGTCVVTEPFCHLPERCPETRRCVDIPGDSCANPIVVDSVPFSDARHTRDFTNQYGYGEGWCPGDDKTTGFGASDVAYHFIAPESGLYRIGLNTGTPPIVFDASLYLVGACDDIEGSCIAADDRARDERIWHTFTEGEEAFVIVDGWTNTSNRTGAYTLEISRCEPTVTEGECGSDGCNGSFGTCGPLEVCSNNLCRPRPGLGCQAVRSVTRAPWSETIDTTGFAPNREPSCTEAAEGSASPDITYRFTAPEDGVWQVRAEATFPVQLYASAACDGPCVDAGQTLILTLAEGERAHFVVDGVDGPAGEARGGSVRVSIEPYCEPQCDGRECGDDGCGRTCGTCVVPADLCHPEGRCVDPVSIPGNTCLTPFTVGTLPFEGAGDTREATNAYLTGDATCPGWVGKGMGSNEQVWRLEAPADGLYLVEVHPAGWDAALFAASGCGLDLGTCLGASDAQETEHLWLELGAGEVVHLVVDGHENVGNDAGPYTLRVSVVDEGR